MRGRDETLGKVLVAALVVGLCVGWAGAQEKAVMEPAAPPKVALEPGFVSLFNGKDLTGWDGDPRFWSVKDGAIRGQTTLEKKTSGNTFCVWRAESSRTSS